MDKIRKQGEGGDAEQGNREEGDETMTTSKGSKEGRRGRRGRVGRGRTGMDLGREVDKVKEEDLTRARKRG